MAARGIALGRIIDWFKNCDPEEGKFAIHRAANIMQGREAKSAEFVNRADAAGKKRRTAKAKPQAAPAPLTPTGEAQLSQAAGE